MKKTLSAFIVIIFILSLSVTVFSALPEKYRTDANTPVLNQRNNPLCWAYAGADLLNISAVKSGQASAGAVFSAPMMARAEFDGNEHRHSHGIVWNRCYGSLDYALMAGISGKGLLPDGDYPTIESASSAPVSALYGNFAYIDGFVERDVSGMQRKDRTAKLKEWITEYGAVACDAFIGDYNNVTHVARTLTYDNSKPAHQLLLIGWDDTKYTDTGTGAFIMKNTWGPGWGDGGYAYISYNTEFGRTVYAASVKIDGDVRVLTHTEVDMGSGNHTSDKTLYGAVNVFTATEKLTLEAAGIYTTKENSALEAKIFVNLSDPSKVSSAKPDATAKLTVSDAGYYTLPLDRSPVLKPGDTVTVFCTVHANGNYYVFSEYSDPDLEMTVTSSKAGQSYTYVGGELKTPSGNYIGTLVCRAEHKEAPPVTQTEPVTEPVTDEETECVHEFSEWVVIDEDAETKTCLHVCLKCGEQETVTFPQDGTEQDTDPASSGTTGTDTASFITFGEDTDAPVTSGGGSGASALKKLFKAVLITVAVIIALILILTLSLIAASKKKKQ